MRVADEDQTHSLIVPTPACRRYSTLRRLKVLSGSGCIVTAVMKPSYECNRIRRIARCLPRLKPRTRLVQPHAARHPSRRGRKLDRHIMLLNVKLLCSRLERGAIGSAVSVCRDSPRFAMHWRGAELASPQLAELAAEGRPKAILKPSSDSFCPLFSRSANPPASVGFSKMCRWLLPSRSVTLRYFTRECIHGKGSAYASSRPTQPRT